VDKVHVIGRIFPSTIRLSIRSPELPLTSATTGLQIRFKVSVQDWIVNVECHLEKYGPEHFNDISNGALDYAKTLINLIGFATGIGISVVFEYAILPDGEIAPIMTSTPGLDSLCTAYGLGPERSDDLRSVIQMVIADRNLYKSFNDLIDTQITPHISLINGARVIESIRWMIAPNIKRDGPAWVAMRKALNVSEAYLRWITKQSKGPRHGDPSQVSASAQLEATERAWKIMNRYLEYRKRGSQPLAEPEFPELN
jgi:hypothetical protein